MGPLVPEIIGNELNFVVALLVGIAFGFILEQAGFSTSKKLVGLFYGYDFTVLRVFFTAGLTAMIGVLILTHYGVLDMSLVYVNPLFLWSAIVGGLIMGLGFVIGGYCPGTSFCGAAIGKIDAMVFIAGSFIGVYIFAEGYPLFENLYKAEFLGSPQIFETFGMSRGLFGFVLILVAVGAFWMVTYIEKRQNNGLKIDITPSKMVLPLTGVAVILAFTAFFFPEKRETVLEKVSDKNYVNEIEIQSMSVDELALRLMLKDKNLQLIDVRSFEEFKEYTLPNAVHAELEEMFNQNMNKILNNREKVIVIFGNDDYEGRKAAALAKELGYKNVGYLSGGLVEFKSEILDFEAPDIVPASRNIVDKYKFRSSAAAKLPAIIEAAKPKEVKKEAPKRVLGGC